ncbi:MAG: DMT family transporter [Minwuia sp.]|uniref:DMT family transporter n=1 Tax=Minwuia sp. TaxID=2493630 RepID=UPI003A88D755
MREENASGPLQALLPHAALFLSVTFLGTSFVAARAIMDHSDGPATLGMLRYVGGALCLLPFVLAARHWRMQPKSVAAALALGVLQFGVFHLSINTALQEIPAARGAVIFALIPILTMLIAAAFGRDRITAMMTFASILSFIGVGLAVGEAAFRPAATGGGSLRGEALFLFAVCCGATYNALSARLYQNHSVLAVSILTMTGGFLFLTAFSIPEGTVEMVSAYAGDDWLWLAWLILPGGAMSMALFNFGLRRLGPSRAAIWVPLSPIAATAAGAALLGETITPLFLVGLACAVSGPLLVSWSRARAARKAAMTPPAA